MKVELHPCYILHQRPYRETSLLLDAFSSEHGRVGLIARGVKRRGNRPALLQPARRLNIAWSMRSELGTLTAVEPAAPPARLAGTRMVSCFYMNELLVRTLHGREAYPELFHRYEHAITGLDGGEPEERVLRIFEKHLLKSLGYGLILDHDTGTGEPVDADRRYYYRLDQGPVAAPPQEAGHVSVSGSTLQALDAETAWDGNIAREAKLLLRTVLDTHTGGRPLGSRELYKAYIRHGSAGEG